MRKNHLNVTNDTTCLLAACPKSGECARHQNYQKEQALGSTCIAVLNTQLLNPTADGCQYGLKSCEQRIAYGFKKLYATVPRMNSSNFHSKVPLSSCSEYYRYRNGEKGMDTELQERMLEAFARQGADVQVGFDNYRKEEVLMPL